MCNHNNNKFSVNPRTGNEYSDCDKCKARKRRYYQNKGEDPKTLQYKDGKPSTIGTWATDEYLEELKRHDDLL